jgi:cardiolipin synthase
MISDFIEKLWPHITATFALFLTIFGICHVVINKKDSRTAVGWAGIIFLFPYLGALLYLLFGINRIKRRASGLRDKSIRSFSAQQQTACPTDMLENILPNESGHLMMLERLAGNITRRPLVADSGLEILLNGDEAYPAMVSAIENARHSVSLATFIFADDDAGKMFVEALSGAAARGVQVRVLIDDVGSRFSFRQAFSSLRRRGITAKKFMPTMLPWRAKYMNLRNHRKILVVDGKTGFTGGMNISLHNMLRKNPRHPVQDIHFRVTGPVVRHLQEAFAEDWLFTSGEELRGEDWFPHQKPAGTLTARGITDGPDEDFEKLHTIILGALSCARHSVSILTPYFLPEPGLIDALTITSMRGVDVDILVPERGNHRLVAWAGSAQFDQLLAKGCRIWLAPPPFDHSKIMVVDDAWSLIGSANWDARSLKLNFEFNVECYSPEIAEALKEVFDKKKQYARPLGLEEVNSLPLAIKIRNGLCRLFLPYL